MIFVIGGLIIVLIYYILVSIADYERKKIQQVQTRDKTHEPSKPD
jgi:hypothetical protein